jgi:ankyrin repeat protein
MTQQQQDEILDAVKAGDQTKVAAMLATDPALAGARNERGESPIQQAQYRGHKEIVRMLLDAGAFRTVFEAAMVGDVEQVRREITAKPALVKAYASDGFHLLGLAAFFSHPEVVDVLLEHHADVDQAASNPMKVTALHAAASSRQTGIVAKLLARGADPNLRQQGGWTALHGAAANGTEDMVRLLLAHGADPSLRTDEGLLAKDLAVTKGHPGVAALL